MMGGCDGITAGFQSDVPAVNVIRLCDEKGSSAQGYVSAQMLLIACDGLHLV